MVVLSEDERGEDNTLNKLRLAIRHLKSRSEKQNIEEDFGVKIKSKYHAKLYLRTFTIFTNVIKLW